jgi:phosphate starvation-inducible PhoH-like protein
MNNNTKPDSKAAKKRLAKLAQSRQQSDRLISAQPKNDQQAEALEVIKDNVITIVNGVPGSGKTYLAITYALELLLKNKTDRIILTRPYVEAGEKLGFLPGTFEDKTEPFMLPIMEILSAHLNKNEIEGLFSDGKITILPLAYMRGITFNNCFVILDEAQNASKKQLHMFLTRMGENARAVITGDVAQSDIGRASGLDDAIERLEGIDNLGIVELDGQAIVRHPIVMAIDERYAGT